MKRFLCLLLALLLSVPMGITAFAGTDVYAYDSLVPDSVHDTDGGYPVCSGLLVYLSSGEPAPWEYTALESLTFTPGADGRSGTYDVAISLNEETQNYQGVYLELLFTQAPETPPVIKRIAGDDITVAYSGSDDYTAIDSGTEPSSTYDATSHYYWYYCSRGKRSGSASFRVELPAEDGTVVHRVINLSFTRPETYTPPADPADFGALLDGERQLHSYGWNSVITSHNGIMPFLRAESEGAILPDAVRYGTVRGFPALAISGVDVDLALGFEPSEFEKQIGFILFDSEGYSYGGEQELAIADPLYLPDDFEAPVGYGIEALGLVYGGLQAGDYLMLLYNKCDEYYPVVFSLTDDQERVKYDRMGFTEPTEPPSLPQWHEAWDLIALNFGLTLPAVSNDSSGLAGERNEEIAAWQLLLEKTDSTALNPVSFNAGFCENIPYWVIDSLAGSNVTLRLTFRNGDGVPQTVEINCSDVVKTEQNRLFFRIADFAALYGKAA